MKTTDQSLKKRFYTAMIALLAVLLLSGLRPHPFHVSVCEINLIDDKQRLEIVHKIFIDDLEDALKKLLKQRFDLLTDYEKKEVSGHIHTYIRTNFDMSIDGKKYQPTFIGCEAEEDALWCYFEVNNIRRIKEIEIKNSLLFELFDDQENIVHFTHAGRVRSLRMNRKNPSGRITIQQ